MTQCTSTATLLRQIGDEVSRRAVRLHDELGLPREAAVRWAHDQRADERRVKKYFGLEAKHEFVRPNFWKW